MSKELYGYKGKTLEFLSNAETKIGDRIKIFLKDQVVEGILMPRSELGDQSHIIMKLSNGYNIGVRVTDNIKIQKITTKDRPVDEGVESIPKENPYLPLIPIIGTGGTIASKVEYRTGAVFPSLSAEDLYRSVPELSKIARIRTTALFNIFSENITPYHWGEIAKAVAKTVEEGADGIVVAHGTDTMGYTAAALSFALQNLPVPVILVGSQRSPDRPSSDTAINLIGGLTAAAKLPFAEVMIAMHETISDNAVTIFKGTKARKCHTSRRDAFKSVNEDPVARIVGDKITIINGNLRKRDPSKKVNLKPVFSEKVSLLKYYPGFESHFIEWLVARDFHGLILEGTGLGHINKNCFNALKNAISSGMLVGMTSQCIWGNVRMTVYDTARDLLNIGVMPLESMLPETALVKMMWAFGQKKNTKDVRKIMTKDIVGEYTARVKV